MAEKIFELYLDESGSFVRQGEHTLIGGVLIPHKRNPSAKTFRAWEKEIRSAISESGVYDQQDLAAGDEWHDLYIRSGRKPGLSAKDSQRFAELEKTKRYVFAHCRENERTPARWIAQGWVLREYLKRVNEIEGVPVIFDNPEGVYYIDSNTTFMSIFAGGVVKLYDGLMKRFPKEEIILNIHAASRLNVTRKFEKEQYDISPLAGEEANLERSLYINQISNYVFLNGGYELLGLDGFKKSMESFDILQDTFEGGKQLPNPSTVICDYICNCVWADTPLRNYTEIMKEYGLLQIQAFGENPDLTESRIDRMIQDHDWLSFLKNLISRGFPEKETEQFFTMMKQDRYDQQLCVNGLVDFLFSVVNNPETMPLWISRLDQIMERCKAFSPESYESLKASLLIYKQSLQTYLGRDSTETQRAFAQYVRQIQPVEKRDHLLLQYCNRRMATETDCFHYDQAREWFGIVRHYTENQLKNSEELINRFPAPGGGEEASAQSAQYGKALSSYIQMLTKEYRNASPDRKTELRKQADEAIRLVFAHLPGKDFRAHQHICDFYAETGDYDTAMKHLALSIAEDGEGNTFESRAAAVLEKCGRLGELVKRAYLRYVSMMHRCFRSGDPHGETMLRLILAGPVGMDDLKHLVGNPYPDAVILWHLAGSLAQLPEEGKTTQRLFDCAVRALMNRGELFRTISMAVRAEMLALGLEQKIPENQTSWPERAEHYFQKSFPLYLQAVRYSPFPAIPEDLPQADRAAFLYQLADRVVY